MCNSSETCVEAAEKRGRALKKRGRVLKKLGLVRGAGDGLLLQKGAHGFLRGGGS